MLLLYYITVLSNHTQTTSISSDSTTEINPTVVTSPTTLTSLSTTSTPGTTTEQGTVYCVFNIYPLVRSIQDITGKMKHVAISFQLRALVLLQVLEQSEKTK